MGNLILLMPVSIINQCYFYIKLFLSYIIRWKC